MAFYFGLNISRNLTDLSDINQSLETLGLNVNDLDVIRGLVDLGIDRNEFKTMSGLEENLATILNRLDNETSTYDNVTSNTYDERSLIDTNLIVNGQVAGTSIKYKLLNDSNSIITPDISTSRVSSWSSFDSPVTSSSPIFYGGEVKLQGSLELSELRLNQQVLPKRFESEIATHRIKVNINGENLYLYAMKGIPLVFRGYFRSTSLLAVINPLIQSGSTIRPSWTIRNVDNNIEYVYQNRLSGTNSSISFNDSRSLEREINFFYPINRTTRLDIVGISMSVMPNVRWPELLTLNIQNNDLREIPDLSGFTGLTSLNIANNDLTRSSNLNGVDLRSFNQNVRSRLPNNLTNLFIGNCFSGNMTADLSTLPLVTLNLRTGRVNRRLDGTSPKINSSTIQNYDIFHNLFTSLDVSVKNATSLRTIDISYNSIVDGNVTLASTQLVSFTCYGNSINLVDVAGKTELTVFNLETSIRGNTNITSNFTNCVKLTSIYIVSTDITGSLPSFINCESLQSIYMVYVGITDAAVGFTIAENTFNSCRSTLRSLTLYSYRFTSAGQFHPQCFRSMTALVGINIHSYGVGISGELPDFSTVRNLSDLRLFGNRLSGFIPNFSFNPRLNYLDLSRNQFTGSVPDIPSATTLVLHNNQLTSFNKPTSRNLRYLDISSNRINNIPDLSEAINLQSLFINNQRLTSGVIFNYFPGALAKLRILRQFSLTNNGIGQGFIDQIILDLLINFLSNPRSGVTVNLRGNSAPSASEEVTAAITRLRSGGWSLFTN